MQARNAILHIRLLFHKMKPWAFRQYVTDWQEWPFRDWYWQQSAHVQNAYDFAQRELRATDDWLQPPIKGFRQLTHRHSPLGEIRFWAHDRNPKDWRIVKRRRLRVFGLLKTEPRIFIVFGAGEEDRNGRYIPAGTDEKAFMRYLDHLAGKGRLYEID